MATLLLDLEVGIQLHIVVKATVGVCQILAPQNVCMMNTYSIFSIYSIDHNYILQSERKSPWVFVSHTQVSPGFSNRWIKLYHGSTDYIFLHRRRFPKNLLPKVTQIFSRKTPWHLRPDFDRVGTDQAKDASSRWKQWWGPGVAGFWLDGRHVEKMYFILYILCFF